MKNGDKVRVAGMITMRQRPETAKGVVFVTIKEETDFANLVVCGKLFDKYRKEIVQSQLLLVDGHLQVEGEVIHVVVKRCYNYSTLLNKLTTVPGEQPSLLHLSHGDETTMPTSNPKDIFNKSAFHKGRNFH